MSARGLQDVVVCAHHGCAFVPTLLDEPGRLTASERAAFVAVDPRAFRADGERRHRAVVAIADELPVTIAVAGLEAVYALFDDVEGFGAVVCRGLPMAVHFAACLERVAGDAARIEGALARARRRRQTPPGIARGVGVDVTAVADGALDAYQRARASLGADVVAAVCGGARLPWPASGGGDAWLLVTDGADGSGIASCSAALGRLLGGCDGCSDDEFVALARNLGCDDADEAHGLLADLMADGLVVCPT